MSRNKRNSTKEPDMCDTNSLSFAMLSLAEVEFELANIAQAAQKGQPFDEERAIKLVQLQASLTLPVRRKESSFK